MDYHKRNEVIAKNEVLEDGWKEDTMGCSSILCNREGYIKYNGDLLCRYCYIDAKEWDEAHYDVS